MHNIHVQSTVTERHTHESVLNELNTHRELTAKAVLLKLQ